MITPRVIIFHNIVTIILTIIATNSEKLENSAQEVLHQNTSGRIFGGDDVINLNEFPFMVSLENRDGIHECGGTIIGPDAVITAAHCFDDTPSPTTYFHIRAGTLRVGDGGYIAYIQNLIIHENYDPRTVDYDVAVMQLDRQLPLGTTVLRAASLPTDNQFVEEPARGLVAGWGLIDNHHLPSNLQKITLPIINEDRCRESFNFEYLISPRMLCAGYVKILGYGPCTFDSGGPLVLTDNRNVLQGIVSWGSKKGCGLGYPGVFTRVASVQRWIHTKMSHLNMTIP